MVFLNTSNKYWYDHVFLLICLFLLFWPTARDTSIENQELQFLESQLIWLQEISYYLDTEFLNIWTRENKPNHNHYKINIENTVFNVFFTNIFLEVLPNFFQLYVNKEQAYCLLPPLSMKTIIYRPSYQVCLNFRLIQINIPMVTVLGVFEQTKCIDLAWIWTWDTTNVEEESLYCAT